MALGMLVVGSWVEAQIRQGVTTNSAVSAASFLSGFVTPLAQELRESDTLTIGPVLALDEVLRNPNMAERVVSVRLWKPDGIVAYSDDLSLVGQRIEPSPDLVEAAKGNVIANFSRDGVVDHVTQSTPGRPLLEIYSPIRAQWTGEVIAIVEFYEDASSLAEVLDQARLNSWLIVGAVGMVMVLALLGIVHSGTILIGRQKRSLEEALEENLALLRRVERASGRSAELTEQQLRRVSADLHDGPAQLVSLAALRVGALSLASDDPKVQGDVLVVTKALADAMQDIRDICKGLSLPEIETQSLEEIVGAVVGSHEARSGTKVQVTLFGQAGQLGGQALGGQGELAPYLKICLYRFLQEGLNNAIRHAGGVDQAVMVAMNEKNELVAEVRNGFGAPEPETGEKGKNEAGIGLIGLRERVEALGGRFSFQVLKEQGAVLHMAIPLGSEKQ
jgi:signal transduction histidine kinase